MMAEPDKDPFKIWPTQLDIAQFKAAMSLASKEEIEKQYPLVRQKRKRRYDPRPPMIEAYLYFYSQLEEYFYGVNGDPPVAAEIPLPTRLEESFLALKNALQLVAIDLEPGDDAQVIFETLNARGAPLLPADLLRNYVFLRASREGGRSQESLYEEYWRPFDSTFWREGVRQGRLKRPRIDLFFQHFLTSHQGIDIPNKHLFVEYKHWIETKRPFSTVQDELKAISRQGEHFKRLISPSANDNLSHFATFLDIFDVGTAYPFLLAILNSQIAEPELLSIAKTVESYLLRRAVCGLTTKNYNRVFLQMTRALRSNSVSGEEVKQHLSGLTGDSAVWPTDEQFCNAWLAASAYGNLSHTRIVYILSRLNNLYHNRKNEELIITGQLSVEHILPQGWLKTWPLPDGSPGLTWEELGLLNSDNSRVAMQRRRQSLLHTFGNLTIVTQSLNSSVSNSNWINKKQALLSSSLLPINQYLYAFADWDERAIEVRGRDLFEKACLIWPPPGVAANSV